MTMLKVRVDFGRGPEQALGPGKVRLLELIREQGSISAAARTLNMSYRRAWLLIDAMNQMFSHPVISANAGGRAGGGAALTAFGEQVIDHFRAIEAAALAAAACHLGALESALRPPADPERPDVGMPTGE
ncbi:MAG: LysR family transcriptional regulator [Azospirillaceae bacterium]|nr:LysR family transcriptional regulator [Azospirillaceae bacterium]